MSLGEYNYGLVFQASSVGFEQVKADLQEGTTLTMVFGDEARKAGERAEAGFMRGYRGISRMVFGFQMLSWIGSMTYSSLMRQEVAMITIEQAQESLNDAIAKYGAHSKQAQRAARSLERAQLYVSRANTMAVFSFASLGMQIGQAGIYMVQYLPQLSAWVAQMWSAVAAQAAMRPWMVPAMAAGALAVGGIAAGYAIGQGTTVNVAVNADRSNLHEAFQEAERQASDELSSGS